MKNASHRTSNIHVRLGLDWSEGPFVDSSSLKAQMPLTRPLSLLLA